MTSQLICKSNANFPVLLQLVVSDSTLSHRYELREGHGHNCLDAVAGRGCQGYLLVHLAFDLWSCLFGAGCTKHISASLSLSLLDPVSWVCRDPAHNGQFWPRGDGASHAPLSTLTRNQ